jgi:hypothetical protein
LESGTRNFCERVITIVKLQETEQNLSGLQHYARRRAKHENLHFLRAYGRRGEKLVSLKKLLVFLRFLSVHISWLLLCYRLLRTVHCIYSCLPRYRLTPPCRADYHTGLRQCLLTLLSQLLLSLKQLPQLHSCRSSIVRVKRYSYCLVPQSSQSHC